MNNGVNNTNNEQNTLTPMAGVTYAPPTEEPINASNGNSTQVVNAKTETVQEPQSHGIPQIVLPQPEKKTDELRPMTTTPVVPEPQPVQEPQPQIITPPQPAQTEPVKKKKINLVPILLLIVVFLIFYIVYTNNNHQKQIANIKYNCTPISTKEETKLDINSTLVKDLYSKVKTGIREDIANPNFDDSMKLYLAYRQIKEQDKYDTNCDSFNVTAMEPYVCEVSTKFVPKGFKEETLELEIKKLFGEESNIQLSNIQLGKDCLGGYQYIKDRKEFVEGYCKEKIATSFKVTKTIKEATSTKNTIILKEEVKYHENEKMNLPEYLKSGIYTYTFRLDMNYNYILVSKEYTPKY